jgi:ATP-dependent Lon protease
VFSLKDTNMSTADVSAPWPVLPLKNAVLFPHLLMPLAVGRPASRAAMDAALSREDKSLVIVAQKDATVEEPAGADLYSIGTQAVIRKMDRSDEGVQVIVQGMGRVRIEQALGDGKGLSAVATLLPEPSDDGPEVEALHRAVLEQVGKVQSLVQVESPLSLIQIIGQAENPLHQVYLLASMLNLDKAKSQSLLECATRADALRLIHDYLSHEVQVLELRQKITSSAQSEMSREQREYLLRQQLRAIQDELGEKNPEQAEVNELRERMDEAKLPEEVRKEVDRELSRLERLPTAAPDYQMTRTYVELVLELPWNNVTDDVLELPRARQVLDEDHYDLKEIKQRIVEHLAVLKLNPTAKAPILCFVGPPGVGKTSLGQSIARAIGRKFERTSLGGMHDEAELRGHRRTYIGAMPGRIIQAIRRAGVRNPVLMMDEIDKLGRDYRGDPAAALLEVLDPAQNNAFRDNYLDLPFDLSKVFFITTANTLDTVPQPLLDRMEILRLAGYTDEEKLEISKRYLIPRQISETGLTAEQVTIPDATIMRLITRYTREAGVRQIERTLARLCRSVAMKFADGNSQPVRIEPDDVQVLIGPERFFIEEARQESPPGVAAGLAWTEAGGDVLYIEAVLLPGGSGMHLTGHLGEVMQESGRAAQAFVWSQAERFGIDRLMFKESGVHLHVPSGAVPKDGPSAGVTMAAALASLYTQNRVRSDTAMTGEITLTGLVLPVGGIKEKVLAAQRAGLKRVILPLANQKDLAELPDKIREELEFLLVDRIDDVLTAAMPELAERLNHVGV